MTIWVAYYLDFSACAVFETEIDALRYAVEHQMHVKQVSLPITDLREALSRG